MRLTATVHCGIAAALIAASSCPVAPCQPVSATGETRQPRNIYELIYSVDHTFSNILTVEELLLYRSGNPEEIRRNDPELYNRISQDVQRWTDEWIQHVRENLVPIPEKKLARALSDAEVVDSVLRSHFETRGWPYKTLRAVFLPPQVFLDEYRRGSLTSGMFIRFYPDAFFASVDWPVPMRIVLVHESLHFNKLGTPYGRPLTEGITESATRQLVLDYELLSKRHVRKSKAYPVERRRVDFIIDEMMKRAELDERECLELLLEAYVTGNQDKMNAVFGAEAWARVVNLSHTSDNWSTRQIRASLEHDQANE